jgi:hypothetical protein
MREELIPMEKIDRRHVYGIVLDTETANTIQDENGLDMSNVLFYDLGFQLVDSHGRTYGKKFSFVNSDIFTHEAELMQTAYYAKKIPQYRADLASGKRILANTYEIRKALVDLVNKYECKFVCAHNARFDYNSLNNTQRWTTKSRFRYFLPYGLEWWDTLKMARSVMGKMPTYQRFCTENGYTTKTGKPRFTAEICYRFITKDNNFKESHTGLEDVEIETEILRYCHRQHKAMKKKLWEK